MSLDDTLAKESEARRKVRALLKEAYEGESDDKLDSAAAEMVAAGATVDPSGKVRCSEDALRIAPKLANRVIKGTSDEAKLARAEQITRRAGPLRKGANATREALKKIPPLAANATDEQKCARAVAMTAALHASGIHSEDPDGSD